jgi:hypothetical protein
VLGGDHAPSTPVGRAGSALNQPRRFEIVEETRHRGAVDAEVLGQRELTAEC